MRVDPRLSGVSRLLPCTAYLRAGVLDMLCVQPSGGIRNHCPGIHHHVTLLGVRLESQSCSDAGYSVRRRCALRLMFCLYCVDAPY